MKKTIMFMALAISASAFAITGMVPACVRGEVKVDDEVRGRECCSRMPDYFVAKYKAVEEYSITNVLLSTDLPYVGWCVKGDAWLFLFDNVATDGRFMGVRAYVPYCVDNYKLALRGLKTHTKASEGPGRVYVSPYGWFNRPDEIDDACAWAWKVDTVTTNYYPLVHACDNKMLYMGHRKSNFDTCYCRLELQTQEDCPDVQGRSHLYYAVVTTNITVRLDNQ